MADWFAANWFTLLSAFGIIGSLCFTAFSLRSDARTRRIANLLTVTANHRELWQECLRNPELQRVLETAPDLVRQPITHVEELFVTMVMLHTSSVYHAMSDQLVVNLEGLRRDVVQFLSLPIPKEIWQRIKPLQNDDFVEFVESCLNWK